MGRYGCLLAQSQYPARRPDLARKASSPCGGHVGVGLSRGSDNFFTVVGRNSSDQHHRAVATADRPAPADGRHIAEQCNAGLGGGD